MDYISCEYIFYIFIAGILLIEIEELFGGLRGGRFEGLLEG